MHSRYAKDMRPENQEFLWRDRLPVGHISVIAGAPAAGKSTLGYRIAADADVPTIFITTEEQDTTVWRPRVEAAGMDLGKAVHHAEVKFSKQPDDVDYLRSLIERYKARLVIVDPVSNHLRGASIHRDEQVRDVFERYLPVLQELDVALLLQMHLLRNVNPKRHPLAAVPAGVVSIAKAIYLFGDDPSVGADPNFRVLACPDKFNFGSVPASLLFEYATQPVKVQVRGTRRHQNRDYGYWVYKGETQISAKALLVKLAPETKEGKSDRTAHILIDLLRDGPRPAAEIRFHFDDDSIQPPISWRTVQRVRAEMGIEEIDDERDARRKLWKLSDADLATLAEITDEDDRIVIEEADLDIPDAPPEEWSNPPEDDE